MVASSISAKERDWTRYFLERIFNSLFSSDPLSASNGERAGVRCRSWMLHFRQTTILERERPPWGIHLVAGLGSQTHRTKWKCPASSIRRISTLSASNDVPRSRERERVVADRVRDVGEKHSFAERAGVRRSFQR